MKRSFVFLFCAVLAAFGLAAIAQQAEEYSQPKPFTASFFGPWNEAVAKTHVPMVAFEKAGMGLKVTVQIDNHPMDPAKPHWIMWIRVEDMDGNKLAEKMFQATDPSPAIAVFELPTMYEKLKVFERCNIHGIWLNETDVTMK